MILQVPVIWQTLLHFIAKVFFSISTHRLPTWDLVDHHGHICFFSVSLVLLSPARAAVSAGVEEAFLTGFRSSRLQMPSTEPTQVRLSREGLVTGCQTAYRFWGAVREPSLIATQQK